MSDESVVSEATVENIANATATVKPFFLSRVLHIERSN